MTPKFLADLTGIDVDRPVITLEEIRGVNPHRHEMEQLSGILRFDPDNKLIIGYKDVGREEFWVRGHIPGRPLMPGILMVEAAAQLCTFYYKKCIPDDRFLGFGGVDKVKFRGTVLPGDKLILIARNIELRPRRATFECQGVVDGRIVFEGIIIGMAV